MFCRDTKGKNIFPRIMKLDECNFGKVCSWFYPKIETIVIVTDEKKVLLLPEGNATVQVSKIILLPTFLVALFMNEGKPQSVVASLQVFVDEFFQAAPNIIKKYMQYIFDYLLAASGSKDIEDHNGMIHQLAVNMDEMELNLASHDAMG